jgi:hypothetical protein
MLDWINFTGVSISLKKDFLTLKWSVAHEIFQRYYRDFIQLKSLFDKFVAEQSFVRKQFKNFGFLTKEM